MELNHGYKVTEAGVLPEAWKVLPLGAVLQRGRLGGNYPNQDRPSSYPLMKMGNLSRGHFDLGKIEYIASGVAPNPADQLRPCDILFNTRNTLELVGKVAIWRGELPVAFYNSNLMRLDFDPKHVSSSHYANYALNSERSVAALRILATGTTSVAAIYTSDLRRMPFVLPPSEEQEAIAAALSDVDALLRALDRLIAKKRDLKQAAMQQLLTGQTRLPGFGDSTPGDWLEQPLRAFATLKSGESITSSSIDGFSPFPCYGGNGLRGYTTRFTHDGEYALIGRQGALCGNVIGVRGKFFASEHAVVVTASRRTSIRWLTFVLQRMHLNQYSESSAQPGLSVLKVLALTVTAPPTHEEQEAIATVLSDMDAELTALEQRREKTRLLKQGMMQELLTGRTRLV